jgi:restriction system protein
MIRGIASMKDIIIGSNKNNILVKLHHSRFARAGLVFCWWFLFDKIVKETGLHLDVVLMIAVLGVVLLNMVYIPVRLLGDKKTNHWCKVTFIVVTAVIARHYFNTTEGFSISSIFENFLVGVIISFVTTIMIEALIKNLKVHPQEESAPSRTVDSLDGWEFEQWCGQWLMEHGFDNVEVTRGSGDYGADVLCKKDGVTYAVQCKHYTGKVPYRAVEEVVTARQYYQRDKSMIITSSVLTPQAQEAADKLKVLVVDAGVLGI